MMSEDVKGEDDESHELEVDKKEYTQAEAKRFMQLAYIQFGKKRESK